MISVSPDISVCVCDTGNVALSTTSGEVTTNDASFKDTLAKAISVSTDTANNVEAKADVTETDVKELISKLLEVVSSESLDENVNLLLNGLSEEQLSMLTTFIEKISLILNQEVNTQNQTPLSDVITTLMTENCQDSNDDQGSLQLKSEVDKKNAKVSDEVISSIAQVILDNPVVSFEVVSDKVVKNSTIDNITQIADNGNIDIGSLLGSISDKVSESNPVLAEFVTKLQQVIQEVSKTVNNTEFELPQQMEITDVKIETTTQMPQDMKENTIVINENFPKQQIKVIKNESELSEITALSADAKQVFTTQQNASVETMRSPVENQVLNFIKTEVMPSVKTTGSTEMTMTLTPEQLGEISVKLVKTGTELTVAITCNNSITQKMIENRLPQLASSLISSENQKVDVTVVTPNENTSEFMSNFNMSQQNGQQQLEPRQTHSHYVVDNEMQDNSEEAEDFYKEGRLWQMI